MIQCHQDQVAKMLVESVINKALKIIRHTETLAISAYQYLKMKA